MGDNANEMSFRSRWVRRYRGLEVLRLTFWIIGWLSLWGSPTSVIAATSWFTLWWMCKRRTRAAAETRAARQRTGETYCQAGDIIRQSCRWSENHLMALLLAGVVVASLYIIACAVGSSTWSDWFLLLVLGVMPGLFLTAWRANYWLEAQDRLEKQPAKAPAKRYLGPKCDVLPADTDDVVDDEYLARLQRSYHESAMGALDNLTATV